jgi:hypothetical protein
MGQSMRTFFKSKTDYCKQVVKQVYGSPRIFLGKFVICLLVDLEQDRFFYRLDG